jgi:hypothetical protein
MRRVLKNHDEVAHIWAQQSQDEGNSNHMFFEGKSIFSYGHHFEIARFYNNNTVLFTVRDYSSSTSQHKSIVRQAINHKDILYVREFPNSANVYSTEAHKINLEYYLGKITEAIEKASRARLNTEYLLSNAGDWSKTMSVYVGVMKCKKIAAPYIKKAENLVKKTDLKELRKKLAERTRIANEKIRLANAEKIENWREGKIGYYQLGNSSRSAIGCMLRICKDKTEVQTSWGASVPIKEAKVLRNMMLHDKPIHGFTIGNYTVTSYVDGILKIGCHTIKQDEIDRIGAILDTIEI